MAPPPDPTDIFPFGLRRPPFQPTADPDFFFRGGHAGDALDRIVVALRARRGVCVLTGETGTGKTTILRKVLVELAASGGLLALCGSAPLGLDDLISLLGASPSTPAASGEEQLQEVARRLRELADEGQPVVLAVDEAQALDEEMLGHLTALVGTAFGSPALGSLLLVGQHALAARLEARGEAGPEIAVSCSLGPLPFPEVGAYIAHRLRAAGGGAAAVFSPAAVERIARLSGGTPRFVNLLCHESLGSAWRQGAGEVDLDVVDRVAEELDFPGFTPLPRLPDMGEVASRRAISPRQALWATVAGAAVSGLLLLPWLTRAIRPLPPAPEARAPLGGTPSDGVSRATGASGGAVGSGTVGSSSEPEGAEPRLPPGSTAKTPTSDGVVDPPSPGRRSDTGNVARPAAQPRRVTQDGRIARTARGARDLASPAPRDRGRGQALLLRVENGDVAGVLALLAAGESPDAKDHTGVTPLMLAAIHGDPVIGDALLKRGATVNAKTRAGQTALMMAAINNNSTVARRLLDRGASLNARTSAGWTALMYAAWNGHPEMARLLLARGADASLRDRAGWTAEHYAAWRVRPPAAAESVGGVTSIDHVEPSRPAGPGHAAVLKLLTESGRPR